MELPSLPQFPHELPGGERKTNKECGADELSVKHKQYVVLPLPVICMSLLLACQAVSRDEALASSN